MQTRSGIIALSILLAGSLNCSKPREQSRSGGRSETNSKLQPTTNSSVEPQPYAQARWRLSSPGELERVVLWVSHILIRHEGSHRQATATQLDLFIGEPPQRTRAEALSIANEIQADLRGHAERFATIARARSEDTISAAHGGSLGGVRAFSLGLGPELLDALAVLTPGEISRVVETSSGFHLILRRAPPPEGRVSGRHVVIGHMDAPTLRLLSARASSRSRSEALALATDIHQSAVKNPELFEALIERYSEASDRAAGGDLGSWSVREPTHHTPTIEVLQQLAVGAIAPLIETPYGVEIVQRTREQPRTEYAMQSIQIPYSPHDAASLKQARDTLIQLSEQIASEPALFDEFRHRYCCTQAERWTQGRAEAQLSSAVSLLAMNEIARTPVQREITMVLPRRVDPAGLPILPTQFNLPTRDQVDLAWVLERISPELIVRELVGITRAGDIVVEPQQAQLLQELSNAEPSGEAQQALVVRIRELLDKEAWAPLRVRLEERFTALMLGPTVVVPNPG